MSDPLPDAGTPDAGGDPLFETAQPRGIKRSYLRLGAIALFVAVCVAVLHFTPVKDYLTELGELQRLLAGAGPFAPAIFCGVAAVAIFVGAPRLVFYTAGGVLFGFGLGFACAQLAALAGAYGPFMFARRVGDDWVLARLERFERLQRRLRDPSVLDVFLCRQLPVWGLVINLMLGTTRLTHGRFVLGTFLGYLPQGVIFTLIGSGLAEESTLHAISRVWGAVPLVLAGALLTTWLVRRARERRGRRSGDAR